MDKASAVEHIKATNHAKWEQTGDGEFTCRVCNPPPPVNVNFRDYAYHAHGVLYRTHSNPAKCESGYSGKCPMVN